MRAHGCQKVLPNWVSEKDTDMHRRSQTGINAVVFASWMTLFSGTASLCNADVFELVGGGKLTGTIVGESEGNSYRIKTTEGIEVTIAKNKLTSKPRTKDSDIDKIYQAYTKLVESSKDTADANREIASEFVKGQKLLYEAHMERVTELDPADKKAWDALGYRKDKLDQWVRGETLQMSRGLVKEFTGRGWTTPHARAIAEIQAKRTAAESALRKEISMHLRNLNQTGPRSFDAKQFFQTLDNPLAIKEILKLLKADIENGGNGLDYIEILERMPGNSATDAFIDIASNVGLGSNVPPPVVSRALDALQRTEWSSDSAVNAFVGELNSQLSKKEKDLKRIDRAGSNLQTVGDKRAIVALINSLFSVVTKTTTIPGTQAMTRDGGVSTSSPRTISNTVNYNHASVLQALTMITGASYGYDTQEWRYWYAREFAVTNMDLRRDE